MYDIKCVYLISILEHMRYFNSTLQIPQVSLGLCRCGAFRGRRGGCGLRALDFHGGRWSGGREPFSPEIHRISPTKVVDLLIYDGNFSDFLEEFHDISRLPSGKSLHFAMANHHV